MATENKSAVLSEIDILNEESSEVFDFDELEAKLQGQLEEELADLELLQEDKEKISNPDALGETIKNVVWEQFINQIATTAGEDFIKENNNLHLDLSKDAHFLTTENFKQGVMPTHNPNKETYQQRYDDWQSNFVKDENGNVVTHQTRSGKEEATLVKGARKPFDDERKKRGLVGNAEKGTDMDETVSVAEIIRDPSANAHMTQEERIEFDLSEKNLNEMDSSWNRSKGDTPTNEWLDNTNSKGQKPQEIFDNMTDEDVEKLRQKDAEAREEFEKKKKEAEQKSIEAGKKSRKEEAFRIGGKALRAVLMQLLAELVREIIAKLVKWFKAVERKLDTLLAALKEAITSFVGKLKTHLKNSAETALTTVATAIWGPIVNTIKKVWTMLKQGWRSLQEAIAYIKNPENKGKSVGLLMLEVGKIVMAGLSAAGAIVLSEVIEKALIAIPVVGQTVFAFEIPLIGSLANILGVFLGAVVAGIIGAIAINLIQKKVEEYQKSKIVAEQIDAGNKVLNLQRKIQAVNEAKLDHVVASTAETIKERHAEAANIMRDSMENIAMNCKEDESIAKTQDEIDKLFEELEDE